MLLHVLDQLLLLFLYFLQLARQTLFFGVQSCLLLLEGVSEGALVFGEGANSLPGQIMRPPAWQVAFLQHTLDLVGADLLQRAELQLLEHEWGHP